MSKFKTKLLNAVRPYEIKKTFIRKDSKPNQKLNLKTIIKKEDI